jgi:hypothetical protein
VRASGPVGAGLFQKRETEVAVCTAVLCSRSLLPVMGNTQSGYTLTRTAATLDSFISELGPEIVYEKRYVL